MPDESRRLLERTADLGGAGYRIFDVTLRTNPRWINTDGFDIHATDVHIRGADVTNGDDSICAPPHSFAFFRRVASQENRPLLVWASGMKSPARDVLVEDSVVRQGNGLVVGTSDPVAISNISFRNCTTLATHFGCHIKFKDQQSGHVSGVVFEDIAIVDPSGYAIGIDQDGQSLGGLDDPAGRDGLRGGGDALQQRAAQRRAGAPSNVTIDNILFRRIHARLGRRTHRHHGTTHTIPYGQPTRSPAEGRRAKAKVVRTFESSQEPTWNQPGPNR